MTANSAAELQETKDKFALCWAQQALNAQSGFDALGKAQSYFADITIQTALRLAWAQTCKRFSIKADMPKGLFILGLGKLGGNDLNFSSDIDLIAFYDAEILPVSMNLGQAYVINQCLKTLTQILTPRNSPRHVWRVDWRLRPESSGTGLALSTAKAEKFYFFRALPWHRLALMKARTIAGDIETGEAFLETLSPFIWRQNLDFRALDDLADLKTRINAEHPGLSYERDLPTPIVKDPTGFNVKLGSGGIREIEFIANAMQLIWGGKQTALQQTRTRQALSDLAKLNHITDEVSDRLREHYKDLRQIENAIQMLHNEQTHIIPNSEKERAAIIALTPYADWQALSEQVYAIRIYVNRHFQNLFETETSAPTSSLSISNIETLSPIGQSIIRSWLNGFDQHGLPQSLIGQYKELGETLFLRVVNSSADTEMALGNIDRFLKNLSRSAQYFDLLARHEALLDTLIAPLMYSPHMTALLEQSPHIIDIFLLSQEADIPDPSAVLSDPDYGTRLDRLRRFVNEHLFLYYHAFMEKEASLKTLQTRLTQLAETTLDVSIQIVKDALHLDDVKMSVMGLGKMGTRTMAPKSDLDLIFIFDDEADSEQSAQIVRRLKTTLMTPLREGIAYELDMRLRPSGRSGPPAVKLSSFKNHHENRAHSWEHIALAHSRIVAGDKGLGNAIDLITQSILLKPRDQFKFLQDAKVMWSRIENERIMDTPHTHCNAKLRAGGLMQAQYIQACYIVLGRSMPDGLDAAIAFWQYQQIWERLLGLKLRPLEDTPERFTQGVFQDNDSSMSLKAYLKKSRLHSDVVINATQKLFAGIALPEHLDSQAVKWAEP
jgi:glutamate-ammonia-ligase adenylyltransferase